MYLERDLRIENDVKDVLKDTRTIINETVGELFQGGIVDVMNIDVDDSSMKGVKILGKALGLYRKTEKIAVKYAKKLDIMNAQMNSLRDENKNLSNNLDLLNEKLDKMTRTLEKLENDSDKIKFKVKAD